MTEKAQADGDMTVRDMATISILSGVLVGSIALCLCNAISSLCGIGLRYDFLSIGFRCVVAVVISLLGLIPIAAIVRRRNDVVSFLMGGPQLALWGCVTFAVGGAFRWGPAPDFMWPIYAGFILYGVALHLAVAIYMRKRRKRQEEDSQHDVPGYGSEARRT